MKRILALLLILAMAVSFAACSSTTEPPANADADAPAQTAGTAKKNSAILATAGEPYLFYALSEKGCSGDDNLVLSNVYDCLTFLEADGSITPGLAESWEISEDGMEYTFPLRKGVKFHDGSDFTADDVVFTYEHGMEGPLGSALFINFDHIEKIDDYKVKIYLSSPYAAFLYGAASRLGGICSKKYYEANGDDGYLKAPIGTGPYKFVQAVSGDRIEFEAFEDYWRGKPSIDNITIKIVADSNTRVVGLENGDYDVIRDPAIDVCTKFDGNDQVSWNYTDSTGRITMYLGAWGGRSGENTAFRKAVQAAINKEEINLGTNNGYATLLDIDICPMYGGCPKSGVETVEFNPEQAKAYLEEAGYDGKPFSILVQVGTTLETAAKIVQSQLQNVGIDAQITAVDNTTFSDMWIAGDYDGIIYNNLCSLVDADGMANFFRPAYLNNAYTINSQYPRTEEIYEICMEGRAVQGDARGEIYAKACNIITEEAYLVPLYNGLINVAFRTDLKGVQAHCLGSYNFRFWSWE